jgi:hypothetical protein
MAKDFKASQVRTTQIIASGSTANKPSLLIASASSPGVDFDGGGISNSTLLSGVGKDVFIFVSGSKNSRGTSTAGVALFGGDLIVSGNISGSTLDISDLYTQNLYVSGNTRLGDSSTDTFQVTANAWFDNALNVSGSAVIAGNLTVKGTSTAVSSSNLTIADPIVYIASGSVGTGTKSAIAFASGSQTANQSLIFGSSGASNILAAAKQDVQSGSLAQSSLSYVDLVPLQASSFLAGGTSAYLSSSNGSSLELAASTQVLVLSGGGGTSVNPRNFADANFFVSGSTGSKSTSTRGTAVFGGDLYVSGTTYVSNSLQIGNATLSEDADNDLTISAGRLVFTPTESEADAFQVATNSAAGLQLASGIKGLGLNSTFGQFTVTSSQIVMGKILPSTSTTPPVPGTDTFIFVSGALNSRGTSTAGTAVFGGDVVVSGTIYNVSGNAYSTTTTGTFNDVSGKLSTTGTFAVAGNLGFNYFANNAGSDTNFFVSGSTGSKSTSTRGTAVFGGDTVISGALHASKITGSLTNLSDGSSYLIAGSNVTITTGSTGAVTIASTGVTTGTFNDVSGKLSTTGTFAVAGNLGFNSFANNVGSDVNFFVSGSVGSKGTSTRGTAVFGGDTVISGAGYIVSNLHVTGNLGMHSNIVLGVVGAGAQITRAGDTSTIGFSSDGTIALNTSNTPGAGVIKFLKNSVQYLLLSETVSNGGARIGTFKIGTTPGLFGFTDLVGNNLAEAGSDAFFYVSGSAGSKGTSTRGTSVFGGDVVISGTLHGGSPLKVSGSMALSGSLRLQTQDSAPTVGSNESVLYVLNDGGTKKLYWKNSDNTQQQVGTGGGVTTGTFNDVSGKLSTTGTFAVAGNQGFGYFANNVGSDVNFFVSGSAGSKGTSTRGTSVFGGDTVISGALHASKITGSLTNLSDGSSYLIAGSNVTITTGSTGAITIASTGGGGGSGDANATYLVLTATGSLNNERVITAGTGISTTDAGAGGNYTISINDSVVATVSGTTFTGVVKANSGLSGSLTKLTDGTSYLIAGTNTSITTGSNGAVTIASTVTGTFNDSNSRLATTASVSFAGALGAAYFASSSVGDDVFFFVSGTQQQKNTANGKTSVFGGDVVISGTLYDGSGVAYIAGSGGGGGISSASFVVMALTSSLSNERVLTAGTGISITDGGANGNVTISATGGSSNVTGTFNDVSSGLVTTASVSFAGARGAEYFASRSVGSSTGADVFFYVSGTARLKHVPVAGFVSKRTLFDGDVVTSGTLQMVGSGYTSTIGGDTLLFVSGGTGTKGNASSRGTSVFAGDLHISGNTFLGTVAEAMATTGSALTGTLTFDTAGKSVFHVNRTSGNITANFTNVPEFDGTVVSTNVILSQSSFAGGIVSNVQINSVASTILWENGVTPTASLGKYNVFDFSLIRSGTVWTTLGQMSTYG